MQKNIRFNVASMIHSTRLVLCNKEGFYEKPHLNFDRVIIKLF